MVAFVRCADRAGMQALVPTTLDWTVRDLVARQGASHRRVAGLFGSELRGEEAQGRAAPEPIEWLRDSAIEVATRLTVAPPDAVAPVFLASTATPRQFWARRVCHETTLHAVDALAASLGRYPVSADAEWITPELASDGLDELLMGFVPRPSSRLVPEVEQRVQVRVHDGPSWLLRLGPHPPQVSRTAVSVDADLVLAGSAPALYLTLWNRSDEVDVARWGSLAAG